MKKLIFTIVFICVTGLTGFAQVGIGTTTPNTSSILDLTSTSKALLLPRLTTTQRDAISNPTSGMVIFNTTTNCMEVCKSDGWYNVCTGTTTGGGGGLPPIDGFTSSNQVAAANLIAYWPFDNTKAEQISGLNPTTNGTTAFDANGRIGGALDFNGANLVYPTITAINNPTVLGGGFTLSMWAKLPVQSLYTSIWQINGNIGDIFGLVGLAHRMNPNDTLDFDGVMTNVDGTGTHSTTFNTALEGPASGFKILSTDWTFLTMSYDSTTKVINYYGNGVFKGSRPIGTIIQPGAKFELVTTSSNPGVSISQVSFGSLDVTPTFPGGVAPAVWQSPNLITGTVIDDTRLFNTTLTAQQISDLYQLGNQGR